MKLKLHCDRSLVPAGCQHVALLDPFWGLERSDPEGNVRQGMERYLTEAPQWFEFVPSPAEADAGLLPVDWSELLPHPAALERAKSYLEEVRKAGRPVIVFFGHDAPIQVDWPEHAVVLRIAVHGRWRKKMEYIIPQFSRDYVTGDLNGELAVREKTSMPTVGFCGFAPPLGLRLGQRWLKESARLAMHYAGLARFAPTRTAHAARARALLALQRSPEVRCNFLIRGESAFDNQYGAFLPGGTVDAARERRREFAGNITGSDYVLCSRGWANCSIRFYETLCLGRVPVLVDTDCVLPYERFIDWEKYCVRVPENDLGHIGARVRAFHDALSPGEFLDRQRACRQLFEDWLSPFGFFQNLYRYLS